jgi:hypothetical protein
MHLALQLLYNYLITLNAYVLLSLKVKRGSNRTSIPFLAIKTL